MIWCKTCVKDYDKIRQSDPVRKAERLERTKASRKRAKDFVTEYKQGHPCIDCGYSDVRALDFDHLRDKVANISDLAAMGASIQTIQKEIAKCEVRCANCHRIMTHERRG